VGALNLAEDVGGLGRTDEEFGRAVMIGQIGFNGGELFVEAPEDAAAEAIDGEIAEKAFEPVLPGRRRGGANGS
jgi:hypothetical protein